MADDTLGLILKLILDKGSQQEAKKGMEDIAKATDNVGASVDALKKKEKELKDLLRDEGKALTESREQLKAYSAALADVTKKAEENIKAGRVSKPGSSRTYLGVEDVKKAQLAYDEELKRVSELQASSESLENQLEETREALSAQRRELEDLADFTGKSVSAFKKLSQEEQAAARSAYEAQKKIDGLNKELAKTERRVADMRQTSESIERISRGLFIAGTGLVGSIYLVANREAQRIKEMGEGGNEASRKWIEAQDRIAISYQRIGRVAITAILPLLEKAAALAEKGSKFVERHPDLVKAAVNTGAVLATVGAVGMLVSRGVRFIADVTLITAQANYATSTAIFKASVDRFLAGVSGQRLSSTGSGGLAGVAGKAGAALGNVTLIATAVIIGVEAGKALGNALGKLVYGEGYKSQGVGDAAQTYYRIGALPGLLIAQKLKEAGVLSDEAASGISKFSTTVDGLIGDIFGAEDALDGLTDGLDDLSNVAQRSEAEIKGGQIVKDLDRELLEDEREYNRARKNIIEDANNAIKASLVNLNTATKRIKANLALTLAGLAKDFAQENAQAERDYQEEYAEAVRDGNEEIQSIRKDAQKELERLEKEFAERSDEATRNRDALALVKAKRDFDEQKKELESNTEEEIAERRRQQQVQLQDMRRAHERERAERLAQYNQAVADAKARAAQELIDAKAAHDEQVKQIRDQRTQTLGEMQNSYNEERRKKIENAVLQIRDLGTALNAERQLRQKYNVAMITDLNNLIASTIKWGQVQGGTSGNSAGSKGGGGGISGRRDSGGYVGSGLYQLHANEFVLSPGTTQAAEGLIGAQLTQHALLATLAMGARASFQLTDARRFDSSIPLAERRAIEEDAKNNALAMFASVIGSKR